MSGDDYTPGDAYCTMCDAWVHITDPANFRHERAQHYREVHPDFRPGHHFHDPEPDPEPEQVRRLRRLSDYLPERAEPEPPEREPRYTAVQRKDHDGDDPAPWLIREAGGTYIGGRYGPYLWATREDAERRIRQLQYMLDNLTGPDGKMTPDPGDTRDQEGTYRWSERNPG